MKKVLFVVMILVIIVFFGTLGVQAFGSLNNSDYDFDGYMMDEMDSYEFMYINLSSDDQTVVDQTFAQLLIDHNASQLSTSDLTTLIDNFKNDMLDEYGITYTYGMGMMGYRYSQYDFDFTSYAWYYMHLDETDQELVDEEYATLLSEIDYTNLTVDDLVTQIADVHQSLITYIETLD